MAFSLTENASVIQIMNSLLPPGSGIIYKDPNFSGDPRCAALFSGGSTIASFPDFGFLLGTGDAHELYGQDGTDVSTNFGYPGDPDFATPSYDACTLAFEFQCENSNFGSLEISYAFASDEYNSAADSGNIGFGDAFALLLNGNNIALVPGSANDTVGSPGTAVSGYSINHLTNTEYFVDNNPPSEGLAIAYPDFEPDGFTKNLKATGNIVPGWNTMKIGIVDTFDPHMDSWLFLEGGGFMCAPIPVATPAPTSSPTPLPTTTPIVGSGGGDPHFISFDGVHWDWHGACTVVLSRSNDLGINVQIRTTRVDNPKLPYSYISGIAAKVHSDIVEVSGDGSIVVNGEKFPAFSDSATSSDVYPLSRSSTTAAVLSKTHRGKKHLMVVYDWDLGGDRSIQISANSKTGVISVDMQGSFPNGEGLLGRTSSEQAPLLGRDGITDFSGYHKSFAEEWQVLNTEEHLFQEAVGPQHPAGCIYDGSSIMKGDEAKKSHHVRRRLMQENEVTIDEARNACANVINAEKKEFCIVDVMAMADVDQAEDPFYH